MVEEETIKVIPRADKEHEEEEPGKMDRFFNWYLGSHEFCEGILFLVNSIVFMVLGGYLLRVSGVAGIYVDRVKDLVPQYAVYIDYGYIIGVLLMFFAVLQVLMSARNFYRFKESKRIELYLRGDG